MYKLIIVEDEYLARTGIEVSITESGLPIQVTGTFTNGLEAHTSITQSPPDILITDIRIAGIDGIELLRRARKAGYHCKALVISCLEDAETLQEAMKYQISGYLFKATMTAQELTIALKEIIHEIESQKPGSASLIKPQRTEIKRVLDYINTNLHEPLHLHVMAEIAGFSTNYFSNLFTQECGISYVAYVNNARLKKALELLPNQHIPIQEVASICGFNDESYFSRCFKAKYGISPGKWRKQS